jgi:hypothetical protein
MKRHHAAVFNAEVQLNSLMNDILSNRKLLKQFVTHSAQAPIQLKLPFAMNADPSLCGEFLDATLTNKWFELCTDVRRFERDLADIEAWYRTLVTHLLGHPETAGAFVASVAKAAKAYEELLVWLGHFEDKVIDLMAQVRVHGARGAPKWFFFKVAPTVRSATPDEIALERRVFLKERSAQLERTRATSEKIRAEAGLTDGRKS